jgi:hypothetical protein
MTIVDTEGRLFGRWNFIDLLLVVLLLAIGPLGYAAYALFRTPEPQLTSIEPAEIVEGPDRRVTVRGINLRPYLRVSFDTLQGKTFLFQDTTRAVIDLNPLPPGTYDVVLYDFGQEQHRLRQALTVKPQSSQAASHQVVVAGRFINVSAEQARQIQKAMPLPFPGTLLDVAASRASIPRVYFGGTPVDVPEPRRLEVPAALQLDCFIKVTDGYPECGRQEFTLRPKHIMAIPVSGETISFQVDQLRGSETVIELPVRVRLVGSAEAIALVRTGDEDSDLAGNPFALGARVGSVAPLSSAGATDRIASLIVRVQRLPTGWWMGPYQVRVGAQLAFATDRYALTATVLAIDDNNRR